LAIIEVKGADAAKYDEVMRRMAEMGDRVPDGQTHHICYGDRQNLQMIDIFESQAKMEAFGAVLMPILRELGIEATPTIHEV
jgi:hypothetical protein